MESQQDLQEDPYAPRSTSQYLGRDTAGTQRAQEQEQSTSSSSSSTDGYARASTSSNRTTVEDEQEDQDEPLFGGRPFRDAHTFPGGDPSGTEGLHGSSSDAEAASAGRAAADKDGLYALLNVEKDATEEKIREAYKALAVVLHPDKHRSPTRKASAESQFRQVHRAYEILTDCEKRAVYDYFGEAGLKSSWTVGLRGRTPQEMRAEYERQARNQQALDAEALVKSKGDCTATIDATSLFLPNDRVPRPRDKIGVPVTFADRWARVGCTQLVAKFGSESQLTSRVSTSYAAQMVSRNGAGGGNLVGTIKTHFSPKLFGEITATILNPHIVTAKGQYTLDENTFITVVGSGQNYRLPPAFSITYGQKLSAKSGLTGFSSFKSGSYSLGPWGKAILEHPVMASRREQPSISLGLTRQAGDGKGWTTQTSIGFNDVSLTIDRSTKVLGGVKVRAGFSLGTSSGLSIFTNGERRLTESIRLSLGLNFGYPGPMMFRIRINRLGQKLVLPILLSPSFRSDLAAVCTLVPAVGMTALHHLYLVPRKRQRIAGRLAELRRENKDLIDERRESAIGAKQLLEDQARKKMEGERRRNGLVVIEAYYGMKRSFPTPREDGPEELFEWAWRRRAEQDDTGQDAAAETQEEKGEEMYWDVRVPLQALITHGQLIIPGGRAKSSILGFFDPCMGERKHLLVRYLFKGVLHEVTVDDVSPLAAPVRAHQL